MPSICRLNRWMATRSNSAEGSGPSSGRGRGKVWQGDPVKTTLDGTDRQYVGTISWFSDFSHRHQADGAAVKKTMTFDVTNQLRALGAGTTSAGLTTVIEATNGLVSDNPANVSTLRAEAATSFQPEANLRIGSIELQTVAAAEPNR